MSNNNYQFTIRLVRLHNAMCLANILEFEDSGRLGFEFAISDLFRNCLERNIRELELGVSENKTTEES